MNDILLKSSMPMNLDSCISDLKTKFTDSDLEKVLNVLGKYQEVQQHESKRAMTLEVETGFWKKIVSERKRQFLHCPSCNSIFILLINPAVECSVCHEEFCNDCLTSFQLPNDMLLCEACKTDKIEKLKTGKWIARRNSACESENLVDKLYSQMKQLGSVSRSTMKLSGKRRTCDPIIAADRFSQFSDSSRCSELSNFKKAQSGKTDSESNSLNCALDSSPQNTDRISTRSSVVSMEKSVINCVTESFSIGTKVQGEVFVKIYYYSRQSELRVSIIRCDKLPLANPETKNTNPYVKMFLLPDKSSRGKRKTEIRFMTTAPIFNEEFSYQLDRNSINDRTLNVSVWHSENSRVVVFLGEVNIPLSTINFKDVQELKYCLQTREHLPQDLSLYQYKGELLICLKFIRQKSDNNDFGSLKVFIKGGKNLGDSKSTPNPYVKCNIIHNSSTKLKAKTKHRYQTSNPIWEEPFTLNNVTKKSLEEFRVDIVVMSKSKMSRDFTLGKLILSKVCRESNVTQCKEKDVKLWRKFISSPNKDVEDYLPLRSIME